MKQSLKVLALSAAVLLAATVSKAAAKKTDETGLGAAAQNIDALVQAKTQQAKSDQAKQVADARKAAAEKTAPISSAGKGLRTKEFPIDAKTAQLSSYILKTPVQAPKSPLIRATQWICRASLTCASGRQISCWARGENCDSYSNPEDGGSVLCRAWPPLVRASEQCF